MLSNLFAHTEGLSDFILELQRKMTAIPAIGPDNGGGGEAEKARYLFKVLKNIGVDELREINAPDARVAGGFRPNIAAKLKGKSDKTLWIIGHMDVVPVGEESLWRSNPFELKQDGDTIYGRGVEDNQQAICTALLVLKSLKDKQITPDLSLGLLFVSDEETHSEYGMSYIMEAAPEMIAPDDLVLVPDMGDPLGANIEVAEKSCLWLKITITGKQCHASTPDEGVNSLLATSASILALDELHNFFPQSDLIYRPARSTFVPSKKESNVENINTVPGLDIFYMDCRVLPEIDLSDVISKAQEIVNAATRPYGAGARVKAIYHEQAPEATRVDSAIYMRLARSLKKLRNLEPTAIGIGGQTVCAILRARGIPCVAWSTIFVNPHTPNEKSSLIYTISDAKIVLDMLFD